MADFAPSKSQRRTLRRNAGMEREATSPWATEEQYALFRAYLDSLNTERVLHQSTRDLLQREQKLQEELGVVRQEGQTVEDAVKDRLEDKLKEELLKIFD